MSNIIDKKIEEFNKPGESGGVLHDYMMVFAKAMSTMDLSGNMEQDEKINAWLKQALLEVQKETARDMVEVKRTPYSHKIEGEDFPRAGVTIDVFDLLEHYKQITGEDYGYKDN